MNTLLRKIAVAAPLCVATLAISASPLHGQTMLLKAATGTTVFESSQNNGTRAASNLFDGTPVFGSTSGNGALFDAYDNTATTPPGGTNNDYAPIVAFDLGAAFTVSGAGYANNIFNADSYTGSINIFTLSASQYSTYTATLLPSETTASQGGLVNAPTSFLSTETLTITDTADANYTRYNLATPLTGEYYVLQFNNSVAGYTGTTAFLGGQEFEFVQVPEPTSLSFLVVGLGAAAFYVRRRRAVASR